MVLHRPVEPAGILGKWLGKSHILEQLADLIGVSVIVGMLPGVIQERGIF
jgi:hypothetical protein